MRRAGIAAGMLFCSEYQVLSQTDAVAYFVTDNAGSKIVYAGAVATTSPVVPGTYEDVPPVCPSGSFWVLNKNAVVSCTGDTKFAFTSGAAPAGFPYANAIPLKLQEGPGTDKPPPMKLPSEKEEAVKP